MKKIAIAYQNGCIGGTTTSLISLLDFLDYSKVDVTLLCYNNEGPFISHFNKNVKVVFVGENIKKKQILFYAFISFKLFGLFFRKVFKRNFKQEFRVGLAQIGGLYRAKKSKTIEEKFDLVIGFMEYWANYYACKLNGTKTICLIHPNYGSAHFDFLLDKKMFKSSSNIAFVSKTNCDSFNKQTKNIFSNKVIWFPNLINPNHIRKMANSSIKINVSKEDIILCSVSRINYYGKGFDRIIEVAKKLRDQQVPFKWLIVGDGENDILKKEIEDNDLNNHFIMCGPQNNPYPFIKLCDLFLLLSRHEGKPISVSEALVLNKRCIVTDYESAQEQISSSENGYIVSNKNFDSEEVVRLIFTELKRKTSCSKMINTVYSFAEEENAISSLIYEKEN